MTGLETTYYIVAIVFMVILLALIAALVTAIIVIRNKVVALERAVQEKIHGLAHTVEKVVDVANAVREVTNAAKK